MSALPQLVPELDVSSLSASLRFYEEVLGFAVAYSRPDEGFAYLERGGAHLMLQRAAGPGRRFRTAALDRPHGRGVNFQLEVTDVAAVRDQSVSLGYELVVDLEDRWYRTGRDESGQRQLVVADPDGYLWRPFQRLGRRPVDTPMGRRCEDARVVEDIEDPRRQEPSYLLGERAMLEAWLEFHRTTLLLKCEGMTDEGRKSRPVPTSNLSLHGLVRHMAEVERSWFRRTLLREPDTPYLWRDPANEDSDLVPLDAVDWDADLALWKAECDASRTAAAAHELDDTGLRHGAPCSLRWIYCHMIEEYARHNGHADLIRELVDGSVGW